MSYLLDTNIVFRRMDANDVRHLSIKGKIDDIGAAGDLIYVTSQNLIEFRNVATRPQSQNGLGCSSEQTSKISRQIERLFPLLVDTHLIYAHWRDLVDKYAVCGKQVHDARLVAVMLTYGVTNLLTLNSADFKRYSEINVVEP